MVADPARKRSLQTRLARWLNEARVQADKVMLDAPADGGSFEELVIRTSSSSDLTVLGMRAGANDDPTDELALLATSGMSILAVRASGHFTNPFPETDPEQLLERRSLEELGPRPATERPKTLNLPDDALGIDDKPLDYHDAVADSFSRFHEHVFTRLSNDAAEVVRDIEQVIGRALKQLERAVDTRPMARRQQTIERIQAGVLTGIRVVFEDFEKRFIEQQDDAIVGGLTALSERLGELAANTEETIVVQPDSDWRTLKERLLRQDNTILVPLKDHVENLLVRQVPEAVVASLARLSANRHATLDGLDGLMSWALRAVASVVGRVGESPADGQQSEGENPTASFAAEELDELETRIGGWRRREGTSLGLERELLLNAARDSAQQLADRLGTRSARSVSSIKLTAAGDPFVAAELYEQVSDKLQLQAQVLRRTLLDATLRELHHELRALVSATQGRLAGSVERGVLADVRRFEDDLTQFGDRLKEDAHAKVVLTARMDTRFDDRAAVATLLEEVHRLASALPETVETLSDVSFEALASENYEDIEVIDVQVRRLVSFVLETDFVGALQESLGRLGTAVQASDNTLRDVLRLVTFDEREAEASELAELTEERLALVKSAQERVVAARSGVSKALANAQEAVGVLGQEVIDRTRISAIHQKAGQLARFMRTYERQQLWSRLGRATKEVGERFRRTFIELSYRYSRTVLLAQQLQRSDRVQSPPAEKLLALHRMSAPKAKVEEDLPIFYRQVFIGRAAEDPTYWLGQDSEMLQAQTAMQEHAKGRGGALMVTGPPGSGRSALVQRILQQEVPKDKVFTVRPPEGGCADLERFDRAMGLALGQTKSYEHALSSLPRGACVLIHNLELWWERRPGGMTVVDRLVALIDQYGDQVLFVITCNEYFARMAGRLGRLSAQLLATVHCIPLDARQLREAIMARHLATGLTLKVSTGERRGPAMLRPEAVEPTEWGLARIFSGLFDYSRGYVGASLRAWIAHIESVDDTTVVLRRPKELELDALDALDDEAVAMLLELTLHHQLTPERLVRLTGLDAPAVRLGVNALKRTGLAIESSSGVLMLDPWTTPHTLRWLGAREVL